MKTWFIPVLLVGVVGFADASLADIDSRKAVDLAKGLDKFTTGLDIGPIIATGDVRAGMKMAVSGACTAGATTAAVGVAKTPLLMALAAGATFFIGPGCDQLADIGVDAYLDRQDDRPALEKLMEEYDIEWGDYADIDLRGNPEVGSAELLLEVLDDLDEAYRQSKLGAGSFTPLAVTSQLRAEAEAKLSDARKSSPLDLARTLGQRSTQWTVAQDQAPAASGRFCGQSDTNRSFCFDYGCSADGETVLSLAVDEIYLPNEVVLPFSIDGRNLQPFRLMGMAAGAQTVFTTIVDPKQAADLDAAFARGSKAAFSLGASWNNEILPISLRGSSAAIANMRKLCPAPTYDDPISQARANAIAACENMGPAKIGEGFATHMDFDLDGHEDIIIDLAGLSCGGMYPFCGSGGCPVTLYRNNGQDRFTLLYGNHMYGVQPMEGRVRLDMHGTACNRIGSAGCTKVLDVATGEVYQID